MVLTVRVFANECPDRFHAGAYIWPDKLFVRIRCSRLGYPNVIVQLKGTDYKAHDQPMANISQCLHTNIQIVFVWFI